VNRGCLHIYHNLVSLTRASIVFTHRQAKNKNEFVVIVVFSPPSLYEMLLRDQSQNRNSNHGSRSGVGTHGKTRFFRISVPPRNSLLVGYAAQGRRGAVGIVSTSSLVNGGEEFTFFPRDIGILPLNGQEGKLTGTGDCGALFLDTEGKPV
jgi:hypothetical protein